MGSRKVTRAVREFEKRLGQSDRRLDGGVADVAAGQETASAATLGPDARLEGTISDSTGPDRVRHVRNVRSSPGLAVLLDLSGRFGLAFAIVVVVIVFSFVTPTFFTVGNFSDIATSQASVLLLAVAATVVLKAGDFDLSLSANMIIGAVVLDMLMTNQHVPFVGALGMTLVICGFVGLVNGYLVVVLGLDSFVTTLATMTVLTGVGYGLTKNQVLVNVPNIVVSSDRQPFIIATLPIACLYGWIIAVGVGWIVGRTPLGRRLAILGVSKETALLLGIRRARIRLTAYVSVGILAGFAGFILLGTVGSIDPSSGGQYILTPFAAAFLGTTVGRAARFNILGTVLALYFLAFTEQGLILVGAPSWIADVFNGGALAVALVFAKAWRDRRKRQIAGWGRGDR